MTATLFSLPTLRKALDMGISLEEARRMSRHVATEMAQDGMLDPDPQAPAPAADVLAAVGPMPAAEPAAEPEPAHPQLTRYGGAYNYAVGEKFDRDLDITEIAKRIRAEIKDRVKKGVFPRAKYSVRTSRFSGGESLDVKVGDVDPNFQLFNVERILEEARRPHDVIPECHFPRYTEAGAAFIKALESLHGAYNYDRSDIMTDYFDVNFYGHVNIDWQWEAAEKAKIVAKAAG